ncbi:MAG: hypothetical protein U9N86_14455 [Bacteroidota bacterium]|nr:hypothetical protein [Bacteroidota bacterium]
MQEFLSLRIEDISGEPPIALFTLSTNIQSIQTTLSTGWSETDGPVSIPKILRMLEEQSQSNPHISSLSISDDGRVAFRKVECSKCGSNHCNKNGTQRRQLKGFFNTVLKLRLQKYRCKKCNHPFKVDLNHLIPKYGHYSRDLRALAVSHTGNRALSLNESVELTHEVTGVQVSRETVRLWKLDKGKHIQKRLDEEKIEWSGIYSYDEQYVKIKGKQQYRALIYDVNLDRPVREAVLQALRDEDIKEFLSSSLKDKPVKTFITDGVRHYTVIINELFPEASHQRCVRHAMAKVREDFNLAAGLSKSSSGPLPKHLQELFGEIWKIFLVSQNVKEAEDRFEKIWKKRFDYPYHVRHRLELMSKDFVYLTEYLVNKDVPKTNNPAETYFQRTYPGRIKRKFQTAEGLQAQLLCLEMSKGGVTVDGIGPSDVLRTTYETFAKFLV